VRVAAEPLAGHTTLALSEPVAGWRAGDRLVLPDTRHMTEAETVSGGWTNLVNQWEEHTIQAISGDGLTITLNAPLQFDHFGARDLNGVLRFLPHVGNLTRNVVIRSESATGTRGHTIFIHMAHADIRYAAFRDLGRTTFLPLDDITNHIGRYPVHVHHVSGPLQTPANGYQFTLLGNAVDGGSVETKFKWGVAVHGSHYGSIKDNVVYNYNGASFATEDGSESFNVFDHNFAIRGMGQPNDSVSEARMALGTEGVGFWFRGPNNFIINNVAANFQNPTTEAAYGYVFQFRFLGNIAVPNFPGAVTMGTMGPGQSTTMNGNNMPLLQFENNEVYGATQGGFTYWWINTQDPVPFATAQDSLVKDLKIWHVFNKAVYMYPGQKVTFDGLTILGKYSASSRCCGDGVYAADYSSKGIRITNSDIQGMLNGIIAPMSGFGPEPNLTVQHSFLRNWRNIQVPTAGSVNGCWMDDKLVVVNNTHFDASPGRPLLNLTMVRDVANAGECLTKLDQALVYAYNGVPADNFQIFHTDPAVLPRPPETCTPTTRAEINGLLCPIAAIGPVPPTATLSAAPGTITIGQSATLTWSTTSANTVTIDQGIGAVAFSGTRIVSPTEPTIYTLTATNTDGTVTATATVVVNPPATPAITWTPAALTYGTALGAGQLNATADVPGTFVYSPPLGTMLGAGGQWQLSVAFTPSDAVLHTKAAATALLTVEKGTPLVTWPSPADIVLGTPLGAAQLNATANVPGTFSYEPAAGVVLPAGNAQTLSVTFNPADATNYAPAAATTLLNVTKPTVPVSWNPPAAITYPAPLNSTQLNATAGVPGVFVYTPVSGTVLGAGARTLSVTFTPTDPSFAPTIATVPLTVLKATPIVSWTAPADIVVGTALSAMQLNALVTSPPGTLVYTPSAGTVLTLGPAQRLSVTFTPADTANFTTATATVPITVIIGTAAPSPIKVGTTIAGTFNDATGHSGQSHLVYAPNAGVWWLFTLSSEHDTIGDRTVQSYVSNGPNLATASWTAQTVSPTLPNANFATDSKLAGGRSLGVALRSIGGADYAHVFASAAFDGQTSSNGHIRAQLGTTSITWETWDNPGSPNTASQWQGPPDTGDSGASTKPSWGNSIGISTGGFIHHFSVTMDQEVDCAVGRSTNPDTGASWTNGFGSNVSPTGSVGTAPPWTTAVIDKTMTNECKVLAFAPLASDVMLAVYSNGDAAQPNMTNLRYTRSGPSGTWSNIPAHGGGGHGNVFPNATINQNDWALVPVNTSTIYAFRKKSTTAGLDGALYNVAANSWTVLSASTTPPAPPSFGAGQAFKTSTGPVSGGLFGATDGTNVWLFVINTNTANAILYTKFNGTTWSAWAVVPGTETGVQSRNFISGYPVAGNNQIGLVWTQTNGASFDVWATSLGLAPIAPANPPTATLTAPAGGSLLAGSTTLTATAAAVGGSIAGVQFVVDGVNIGAEDTTSPYSIDWDTTTVSNGTHFVVAVARDTDGATGASTTVTITVNNDVAPTVVVTSPAAAAMVAGASVPVSADAADDAGVAGVQFLLDGAPLGAEVTAPPYTINWDTTSVSAGAHMLAARARDAAGHQTTSDAVGVTVKIVPTITWTPPATLAYGEPLGAAQLNATASVAGTLAYTPSPGAVLLAGAQTLSVTFTPADTTTYTTAAASVDLTIVDTTAPAVAAPASATLEATAAAGAAHFFAASASDPVDGSIAVNCSPPSGATFSLGTTGVLCRATDRNGNTGFSSFTVTVRDTTPPLVTPPSALSVPATEIGGARGNVAGSVGSQNLALFLAGASATDAAGVSGVIPQSTRATIGGTLVDVGVATLFPPGVTQVTFAFRDANGNEGTAVSTIAVTARIPDEPTILQTTATGGARLQLLQNPDGGWSFEVGSMVCGPPYGSCPNTIGTTGLGLLAAYARTHDPSILAAAVKAGDLLITRYGIAIAQTPPALPVSRDIEFLVGLAGLTGNAVYGTTAQAWFQVAADRFPDAADQIDDMMAERDAQGLRSVAAWDAASYIRAAKAVGLVERALAAAVRIRDLEPLWKDTDPTHRFDKCANPFGCGPAGNRLAFDYTLLGEGSLLWAVHDLPGFDAQISEYRSFLLSQQDPAGSWDVGDSQMTSFIVMGLAAVGGTGASEAIARAARFLLAHQFTGGGWPGFLTETGPGAEYAAVDGEIVRAIATLFSTPAGADVSVVPSQLSTVTFSNVSVAGVTTVIAVDQAQVPEATGGFQVVGALTYEVATTATVSGDITVCFTVSSIDDPVTFASLRIMHGENGVLVDRTILPPDSPAPDFAARRVCARTSSLSPFAIAIALPDTTAPVITVPANDTRVASSADGLVYSYVATATDDIDRNVHATCVPPSGTMFPVGTTTVVCTAADAAGNTASASFALTITPPPPNVAPTAHGAEYKTGSGVPLAGMLRASDPNGDALTFRVVTAPTKGDLVVNAQTGAFVYTPRKPAGPDQFTFRVSDRESTSNTVTVKIKIEAEKPHKDAAKDQR
jgi:hypothetical protein